MVNWGPQLTHHGYWMFFLVILGEQAGLPLPAAPALVAAGMLVGDGTLAPLPCLVLALVASLIGHTALFWAGRRRGAIVLRQVCRLSLNPDACVQRTQDLFARLGPASLLVSRFIPGLDAMAQPLAGMTGLGLGPYLALSGGGALLWIGTWLGLGATFGAQVEALAQPLLRLMGQSLLVLVLLAGIGLLLTRLLLRMRLLRGLRLPRLQVTELHARLAMGEPILLLDLRHRLEVRLQPRTLPGARLLTTRQLQVVLAAWPKESTIAIFCNCPYEMGSARLAQQLRQRGFVAASPLAGGLAAWEAQGFATAQPPRTAAAPTVGQEVKAVGVVKIVDGSP